MTGLVIKDAYTMVKQTKFFLLLTVLFALIPFGYMYGYAIFFAAMMPSTALGYDERAKWKKLANMLPYTPSQIVGSKYVMEYLAVGIIFVLINCSKGIYSFVSGKVMVWEEVEALLLVVCLVTIVQAINMPLMFWLGIEKGRIVFIMFTVIVMTSTVGFLEALDASAARLEELPPLSVILGIVVVVNIISFHISKLIYKRKK